MPRLYLLRHAKARWAEPGVKDYDRGLDASGKADAEQLGIDMLEAGYVPNLVLCSGAKRARDTWNAIAQHVEADDVRFLEGLYSSDAAGYLDIIRESDSSGSVLVVGHNPMMEDLAVALSREGEEQALAAVRRGFPACGLAVIRFSTALAEIAPEDGYLEAFLKPHSL